MIKGSFLLWFWVKKNKKKQTAWALPDGPWVDKKIKILPYIITFYSDNDLKLKFVKANKVDISTKEANIKKIGIEANSPPLGPFIWQKAQVLEG